MICVCVLINRSAFTKHNQARSQDFEVGGYMDLYMPLGEGGGEVVFGHASPGNSLKILMLWDCFWGHFGTDVSTRLQKNGMTPDCSVAAHCWPWLSIEGQLVNSRAPKLAIYLRSYLRVIKYPGCYSFIRAFRTKAVLVTFKTCFDSADFQWQRG